MFYFLLFCLSATSEGVVVGNAIETEQPVLKDWYSSNIIADDRQTSINSIVKEVSNAKVVPQVFGFTLIMGLLVEAIRSFDRSSTLRSEPDEEPDTQNPDLTPQNKIFNLFDKTPQNKIFNLFDKPGKPGNSAGTRGSYYFDKETYPNTVQNNRLDDLETIDEVQNSKIEKLHLNVERLQTNDEVQDSGIDDLEMKDVKQDDGIDDLETSDGIQDDGIDDLEARDETQDSDINALQINDGIQDIDIDTLEASEIQQDTDINDLQINDGIQNDDLDVLKANNLAQDAKIEDLETKDGIQDDSIIDLEANEMTQDSDINALQINDGIQDDDIDVLQDKEVAQDDEIDILQEKEWVQDNEIVDLRSEDLIQATEINVLKEIQTELVATLELLLSEMSTLKSDVEAIVMPVGSIIAWSGESMSTVALPEGWQLCDGSKIESGPMNNIFTPNLNGEDYFLRGGSTSSDWIFQEQMLENHGHSIVDPQHTHTDRGHTHGHGDYGTDSDGEGDDAADRDHPNYSDAQRTTDTGYANLRSSSTGITVTDATDANIGTETRPKNMIVQWIIRIF